MANYTFVLNGNGNLNVPYLYENDDKVVLNWNWLNNDWNDNNPALRFANLFISPPLCWGSFVLITDYSIPQDFFLFYQVV